MKRNEMFKLNVEYIVWGYANLMSDTGAPALSLEEVIKMVNDEVYTFIYDGNGCTYYGEAAVRYAKSLKFIPKAEKLSIITTCAEEAGVLC